MYSQGDRPCMKIAGEMGRPCCAIDRMTLSPVSGSLRESMKTSARGLLCCDKSFSARRRWMNRKATPRSSVSAA